LEFLSGIAAFLGGIKAQQARFPTTKSTFLVIIDLHSLLDLPLALRVRCAFRSGNRRRHKARADSGVSETDLELFDRSPTWYMRRDAGIVEPPIFDEGIDLDEEIEKEEAEAEAES
jgi:hypothetical protein